jgi:predicted house-cleaning noncanonical NTP pyrophosphatase (MazG superfamily)
VTRLASREFQVALKDKLDEEVAELIAARTTDALIEEAADVVEVLIAMAGEWGRQSRQHPESRTSQAHGAGRVQQTALVGEDRRVVTAASEAEDLSPGPPAAR